MNMLAQFEPQKTMSSREIADLCKARHNDVVTTIDRLFEKGLLRESRKTMRQYIPANGGRPTMVYDLTKNDTLKVVSGYNDAVRSAIIDRWAELESQAQPAMDLNNPIFLREALLGYTEKVIELEQKVQVLEPKAKGLDRIADCTNVLGIRESAKVLKIGQNQLTQYLIDHKVVYRDQYSKIQAYQKSIDQKLVHVVTSAPRLFESGEKVFTQVKLTQKLITRIAKWLEQGVAA